MQDPDEMLKDLIESELAGGGETGGNGASAGVSGEAKLDSNDSEGVQLAKKGNMKNPNDHALNTRC